MGLVLGLGDDEAVGEALWEVDELDVSLGVGETATQHSSVYSSKSRVSGFSISGKNIKSASSLSSNSGRQ